MPFESLVSFPKNAAEETLEGLGLGQGGPHKKITHTHTLTHTHTHTHTNPLLFFSDVPDLFLEPNAGQLLGLERKLICLKLSK